MLLTIITPLVLKIFVMMGLLQSSAVCCQRVPLDIVQQTGAPLNLSGYVSQAHTPAERVEYSYVLHLSEHNISTKNIVLTGIRVDITDPEAGERGLLQVDDYFFRQDLFRSAGIYNWTFHFVPFSRSRPTDRQPAPTAQLVFVQFEDGSTWGDVNAIQKPLSERNETLQKLFALSTLSKMGHKNEFSTELMKPSGLALIRGLQHLYRQSGGSADVVLGQINEKIKYAEVHLQQFRTMPNPGSAEQ